MIGALARLKPWLDTTLGFTYPEVCQICKSEPAKPDEGYVGADCWQKVRFIEPPFCERCGMLYDGSITTEFECENCRDAQFHFRSARSAVSSNDLVLDVIHKYKYTRALWFEPFLADLLIRQAAPVLAAEKFDMIVPVPLFPKKEREREFNQAERLANRLGRAVNLPVNNRLLQRVKPTETQTRLKREQRAVNVEDAFALRPGARLAGESVVLLDDVFTTGATTSACARVLVAAGAGDVCVWTVARGL